jgi:hypothetical protein
MSILGLQPILLRIDAANKIVISKLFDYTSMIYTQCNDHYVTRKSFRLISPWHWETIIREGNEGVFTCDCREEGGGGFL